MAKEAGLLETMRGLYSVAVLKHRCVIVAVIVGHEEHEEKPEVMLYLRPEVRKWDKPADP
ncbi:MAG: hypothetical protein P4L43_10670 [Syntrophobacteraceae bacterium]|nr:hypothetical protein [Syntrophobacteraceae bacterium]